MKGISLIPIACGSREETIALFSHALATHSDAFNVLLIDADHPVSTTPAEHVRRHFKRTWKTLRNGQCHLMVQIMEAWFLADVEALREFYAKGFHAKAIPPTADVEAIPKESVLSALKAATQRTQKGEYHKIRHASELLRRIRTSEVRKASKHCDALFKALEQTVRGS